MSLDLRRPLALPEDVVITPVEELPEAVRRAIGEVFPGDAVLTRRHARETSRVVEAELAALLRRFRAPSTLVQAVVAQSREAGRDAETLLEAAAPAVRALLAARLLVPAEDATPPPPAALAAGTRLGEITLEACLHLVEDTELHAARDASGAPVAVKVFRDPRLAPAAAREAAALRRLAGRGVAPALQAEGRAETGWPWLAMDWVQGVSAAAAAADLREAGDRAGLLRLLHAVARAYAGLHAVGVLHGDVHPGNVLVDGHGAVRLIDFGLARLPDGAPAPRGGIGFFYEPEWATAVAAGRPPPPPTAAGEQYGVAALLALLTTGQPYAEFDLRREEMLAQIQSLPPAAFVEPWPALEAVLARALAKDPAERFPDMAAFAKALAAAAPPAAPALGGPNAVAPIAAMVEFLDPEGSLFAEGLASGPVCSAHSGAAGIAYGLARLAALRGEPTWFAAGSAWLARAVRDLDHPRAFLDDAVGATAALIERRSPLHGKASLHLVAGLLAAMAGEDAAAGAAVEGFVAEAGTPGTHYDLTLGACGVAHGALLLLDVLPRPAPSLLEAGHAALAGIWATAEAEPPLATPSSFLNLGVAHGWAGLLLTTRRWQAATGDPLPADFDRRFGELVALGRSAGRGRAWPWRETGAEHGSMAGWCNGSAGLVFLGVETGNLSLAEAAGWHAWEAPRLGHDLCCGLAGRAYALLALHRATGDQAWLDRARLLGRAALEQPWEATPDRPTYSLWRGRLGLAVLMAEVDRPELAAMPLFEPELRLQARQEPSIPEKGATTASRKLK